MKGLERDMLEGLGFTKGMLAGAKYYQLPEIMATVRRFFPKLSARDQETVKTHLWGKVTSQDGVDLFDIADTFGYLVKGQVGAIRNLNRQNVIKTPEYRASKDIKKFQDAQGWGKVAEGFNILGTAAEKAIDNNMKIVNSVTKPTARLVKEYFPTGILPPKLAEYMQKTPGLKAAYHTIQNLDPLLVPEGLAAISERGAWRQVGPGMVDLAKRAAKGDQDAIAQLEGMGNSMVIGLFLGKFLPKLPKGVWSAETLQAIRSVRPRVMKSVTGLSDFALKAWHEGEILVAAKEMAKNSGMSVTDTRRILKGLETEFNKYVSGERQLTLTQKPGQVLSSTPTGNQSPQTGRGKSTRQAPIVVIDKSGGQGPSLGKLGQKRRLGEQKGASTAQTMPRRWRENYYNVRKDGIQIHQPDLRPFWQKWSQAPPTVFEELPPVRISSGNVAAFKPLGIDLNDSVRVYNNHFIRHTWKFHGHPKMALSRANEFPITGADLNQIPLITSSPDAVHKIIEPDGATKLFYRKKVNGTYMLYEELRSGNVLSPVSLKHFRVVPKNPNWWKW